VQIKILSMLSAVGLLALLSGCASKPAQAPAASDSAVLDINPAPTPAPVAYAPPPAPVAQPIADEPIAANGGNKYLVQKGDTLWKIATNQYGDGKQWQKICSANPGLTPETLKAGQTITIP
jgi:5'-nucleotidase